MEQQEYILKYDAASMYENLQGGDSLQRATELLMNQDPMKKTREAKARTVLFVEVCLRRRPTPRSLSSD
jgi:hypothetical protein